MASGIHICLAFLFISAWKGASAQVDLTLKEGAMGAVVVRAVIEKISILPLFDDCDWWNMSFMDRIKFKKLLRDAAFVLTEDGLRASGGGIWDIDESVLNGTSPHSDCNVSAHQEGLNKTNTNISTLRTNLSKPMYSGLTAALCIHQYLSSQLECKRATFQTIITGSDYNHHMVWMNAVGTTLDSTVWHHNETTLEDIEYCTIQSDVVFVMDSSLSVQPSDFEEAKHFVLNITNELLIKSDVTNHIGVITYGRTARTSLPLTSITQGTVDYIRMKINNIEQLNEVTNTADGLCLLADQDWRDNPMVMQLAIVMTDGMSNRNATKQDCNGSVEEVAMKIKEECPDILLIAIGIGESANYGELSHIASDNGLISTLKQYSGLRSGGDGFRYEICYTISAHMSADDNRGGSIGESQIMRWVINDVFQDGISIRFCITDGKITFYVAQGFPASRASNDRSATIILNDTLSIVCQTEFLRDIVYRSRRKRQVSQSPAIYILVEGQGSINTFTVQSGRGNVSFDVNECERTPNPCDKSAMCHNTDGSFYCVCNLGYSGDGFKCTSYLFQLLAFLVPSVFMGGLLLFACLLLIIVGICVFRQKPKSEKRNKKLSNSQKAPDKKVLSLSLSTSL